MSSKANKASKAANEAAQSDRELRMIQEEKLKREKMRAQNLFIRQLRGQSGGGFFQSGPSDTLG